MSIEDNDLEISENIRIVVRYAQGLNRDFRERDIDEVWKAASAISVASGDIVRRIVKAMP